MFFFRSYANVISSSWSVYIKYRSTGNMKSTSRIHKHIYIGITLKIGNKMQK